MRAVTITVDVVNGNDANDGQSGAVKTLKAAWALMPAGGGHTMLIKPGTYSDPNDAVVTSDIVNGSIGNYNVIKAEVDGTVIIMQPMDLQPLTAAPAGSPSTSDGLATTPQYLQFEGLKWVNEIDNTPAAGAGNGANVSIVGHHIKILRSAFRGAGNCNNFATLAIGRGVTEAQNWQPTHHILIEDSWSYGLGGRYNISIFHTDNIVIRRVVLRHDGGWNGASEVAGCKNDPEAAIATYNSADVHLQNLIVIDSDIPYSAPGGNPNGNWEGTIYTLYNAESGVINANNPNNDVNQVNVLGVVHDNTGSTITGNIILFSHGNGYKYEVGNSSQVTNNNINFPAKSVTGAVLQDSVALNVANHGITVATGGGGAELIEVDINNVLIATTDTNPSTMFHWFNGACMLGAFFILTDPVSGATSVKGRMIFGALAGFLVFIIR
ncbi:MAG: RnfABCDGE type electron transport complex subunit D, partial [Immundisolibacteraceae bacterium]|nr:RnfABCDGE type electron transport complex subunit D [Immundisolibacteraceae bacterium]